MGRKWNKKKKQNAKSDNKVEKPKRERSDPQGYVVVKKESKNFETFYKHQNIVPEEEWADFISSLQTSLPAAFRITGNTTQAEALLKILKEDFFKPLENLSPEDYVPSISAAARQAIQNGADNGSQQWPAEPEEPIKPLEPKCLSWYTKGLAYQLNLSRRDIRRCEPYWRLHQCLITETDAGSISRQEAVSMIPPLLLDVQPHHNVLDMCAAPGSKTAQIIEQLHSSPDPVLGAIPSGVVVANDADNKRCYLLTHQAKRLQSPSIIITNHDACFMPNMFYTKPDGSSGKLKYDRILCDVPCSGDGTLRKNCDVWAKWNPVNGCNLHGLQLRIARRGLELLRVGGRMVYSTCSMSPMENESVLQRLLLEADGAVSIVDCSDALPGLKFRPGLTKWSVLTKDMQVLATPQDIPLKWSNVYHKHLFPAEQDLNLQRCLRLLPHHQDTGGFFVAVLEKTAPLPGEKVEEPVTAADGAAAAAGTAKSKHTQRNKQQNNKRRQGFKEEPYYYLSDIIADWEKNFKAGKECFPTAPPPNGDTNLNVGQETTAATTTGTTSTEVTSAAAMETSSTSTAEETSTTTTDISKASTTEITSATSTETTSATSTETTSATSTETTSATSTETTSATSTETTSATSTETTSATSTETTSASSTGTTSATSTETTSDSLKGKTSKTDETAESNSSNEPSSINSSKKSTTEETNPTSETNGSTEVTKATSTIFDHDQEDLRIWSTVSTFFGWDKDLPQASYANFMTRSREGKKRNLYFTNALVRDLIDRNQDRMKIINTGVKVLVRTDNKGAACDFRLAQEGIQSIIPLVTKRRLPVSRLDLLRVLNDDDSDTPPELAYMSQPCRDSAADMVTGSVLLEYCGDPTVADDQQDAAPLHSKIKIELVGWKGKSSLRCYVVRSDRVHYLRLLRADTSKYVKNKFTPRAAAPEAETPEESVSETLESVSETVEESAAAKEEMATKNDKAEENVDDLDEEMKVLTKKPKLDLEEKGSIDNGIEKMDTN